MSKIACLVLSIFLFASYGITADLRDLNQIHGKIFKVNPNKQSFEILIPTAYDPKKEEGKSRYTVYWNEKTIFNKVISQPNFKDIEGKHVVDFYYLDEKATNSIKGHSAFSARNVNIYPNKKSISGLRKDGKRFVAWFTPNKKDKSHLSGTVEHEGKSFKASIFKRKATVNFITNETQQILNDGLFSARIYGQYEADKFILSKILLYPLPDPRDVDDPNLPRVLVIGDSISMNYHDSAKAALKGQANYYQVEGNAGPSDRGVSNLELWLGDYQKQGFHWDVIQFNFGLHDLKQPFDDTTKTFGAHQNELKDYKKNLKKVAKSLLKTKAKLIWCTTTPVPNSSKGPFARKKDEDLIYNQAAFEVIQKYPEIQINDINSKVRQSSLFNFWREGNNVHFKDKEQVFLGQQVAEAILKRLK